MRVECAGTSCQSFRELTLRLQGLGVEVDHYHLGVSMSVSREDYNPADDRYSVRLGEDGIEYVYDTIFTLQLNGDGAVLKGFGGTIERGQSVLDRSTAGYTRILADERHGR